MTGELEYSLPPAVRRISSAFKRVGWISFWAQVVLAVVASGILLFAVASMSVRTGAQTNPGTSAGLFLATVGLLASYFSAYWAFRYTRIGRNLRSRDTRQRPSPKDALQAIRLGLVISLAGMLVTLLGGSALVGALLGKALLQPQGFNFNTSNINQYVEALDIFIVQANTNTLLAHFASLVGSLWLLRTVSKG